MNRQLHKLVAGCLLLMGLSGCAHQRYTENANDYLLQGRYELAVQEFEKALRIEPDHPQNQAAYRVARENLDIWLDGIELAAKEAYSRHQSGRALILYGKLAQLRPGRQVLSRYRQLSREIAAKHLFQVDLHYDPAVFGSDVGEGIAGLVTQPGADYRGELTHIRLRLGDYQSKITYADEIHTQSYLSGVETVVNPELLGLQQAIQRQQADVRESRRELRHQRKHLRQSVNNRDDARRIVDNTQARLDLQKPGSEKYLALSESLAVKSADLDTWERRLGKSRRQLKKVERRHHAAERQLADLYEQLSTVPPTVDEEIYSDYDYRVGILTQTMAAELSIGVDNKWQVSSVLVRASDSEHKAHPTINLSAKSAALPGDRELQLQVNDHAVNAAREFLLTSVAQHRQLLLASAEQTPDPAQRLEYWVAYSLAGDRSPNHAVEADIRRHLQLELGRAGEFPVRQLLDLYRG